MPSKDALNFDLTRLMELMETAKLEGESLAASMAIPSSSEVLSEMSNSGNKDINFTLPDIVVPGGVPFPFGSAAPHALNWMTYVHKSKMNRKNRSVTIFLKINLRITYVCLYEANAIDKPYVFIMQ